LKTNSWAVWGIYSRKESLIQGIWSSQLFGVYGTWIAKQSDVLASEVCFNFLYDDYIKIYKICVQDLENYIGLAEATGAQKQLDNLARDTPPLIGDIENLVL
jgi:hypothetical protein